MATQHQWQIYIFKRNSPWGVIKHPTKGNVYKHIVWTHGNTKTEFINSELMPAGETFKLSDFVTCAFTPIDELSFTFKTTYEFNKVNYDNLTNRDFCAVKKPNDTRIYYYTLEVEKAEIGSVTFRAELDVFFTYLDNNLLSDKRESFVIKGHEKRYLTDGTPDWEKVLKNNTSIVEPNKTVGVSPFKYSGLWDSLGVKFYVIYYKGDFYKDKHGESVGRARMYSTLKNGNQLPYAIYLIPFSTKWPVRTLSKKFDPYNKSIDDFINTAKTISIVIKESHELGIDPNDLFTVNPHFSETGKVDSVIIQPKPEHIHNYTNYVGVDTKLYKGTKPISAHYYPPPPYPAIKVPPGDSFLFWINDLDRFYELVKEREVKRVYDIKKRDPILLHPDYYKVIIKKYNSNQLNYNFIRLKDKQTFKLNTFYSFNPESNISLYFLNYDKQFEHSLPSGHFLTIEQNRTVGTVETAYNSFIRDNLNSFNAGYQQTKMNSDFGLAAQGLSTATSLIAGAGSLALGSPIGVATSVISGVSSVLGIPQATKNREYIDKIRQAKISDLHRQMPTITIGYNSNYDELIDVETSQSVLLIEKGLTETSQNVVLDFVNRFGYEVGEFKNIKKFIQTRKRYNYIECDDVFNDIIPNLSPRIKQTINDAFASGLYIWHYRNASDWKGIKNFSDTNEEV